MQLLEILLSYAGAFQCSGIGLAATTSPALLFLDPVAGLGLLAGLGIASPDPSRGPAASFCSGSGPPVPGLFGRRLPRRCARWERPRRSLRASFGLLGLRTVAGTPRRWIEGRARSLVSRPRWLEHVGLLRPHVPLARGLDIFGHDRPQVGERLRELRRKGSYRGDSS